MWWCCSILLKLSFSTIVRANVIYPVYIEWVQIWTSCSPYIHLKLPLNFTWFRHHLDPEFHMLQNLYLKQDHILKLLYCIIIMKRSQINCHKNLAYRLMCAHYMWAALYDGNIPSIIKSNKSHAREPWRHRSRTSSHAATFYNHSPQSQIASMQLEVPWTGRQYGAKRLLSLWLDIRAVCNGITSHVGTLLAAASFIVNMTRE